MKKIFKKILTAVCALTLCIVCFTGCSWLKIDNKTYYNQLVVSLDGRNFYKKDLIEAYNSYGYQYYQSYGYSMQESVETTISSMIERRLLLEEVKDIFGELSTPEMLEIKYEAFEYMQDSIFTYEDQIMEEWNINYEHDHDHESEEETSLRTAKTEYTPTTKYIEGKTINGEFVEGGHDKDCETPEFKIVRVEENDDPVFTDNLPEHFTKSYQRVTDEKVSNEAWSRYVKSLQDNAEAEGRDTSESAVLLYEEERLIETITNNRYLEKYENEFYSNLDIDYTTVLDEYRTRYKEQMSLFNTKDVGEGFYHKAMEKASSEYVYYHVNSGNEYVNVKHILINFSEEQKNEITSLNTIYGITGDNSEEDELRKQNEEYQNRLNKIITKTTTTTDEFNGKTTWTANEVYEYVKSYVTGSPTEKSRKFDELVYVFNDDTGFMNSEFDYVVNLDTEVKDQMVKPFADGVRALDKSNGGSGHGSMDMIVSTYGYHIIFHDGVAENIVDEYNIDNISDANLLKILCTTYTTPNSNKTIFNYLYDKLKLKDAETTKYNNMTKEVVDAIFTEIASRGEKIVYYVNNYKDLWD